MNEIDSTIADVYIFFLHSYDKNFKKNLANLRLNDRGHFGVMVAMSVSSYVIENEEALGHFLERYWL